MAKPETFRTDSDVSALIETDSRDSNDLDVGELFSAILGGKWLIFACIFVFSGAAVIYAINQPNIYKAHVLLAPSSSANNGGVSALKSQFGGLASLAGISFSGGAGGDKSSLALEVVKSRQFITNFIDRYDLLVPLMAAVGWNKSDNTLIIDPEIYDLKNELWTRDVGPSGSAEPTLWEAYKAFRKIFSVSVEKDSGMVILSLEHYSPKIAKDWVDKIVKDINLVMKRSDVVEAQKSIGFLKKQLQNTQIAEMQNVFFQLIEEQTKTIMLSEVRDEYVFTTIDPALAPEERSKPNRLLIVALGLILGAVLGIIFVLIRHYITPRA